MRLHEVVCFFLTSLAPVMAQVWKGEVPDAAKVAALQKAAAKGDPAAMADVAYLSRYCRGGVKYDPKRIFEYSRKSAKEGNAFGMSGLAYCYMQGCGVDANGQEAYRWAKKSADLKHPCGIYRLGVCYELRSGVPLDRKRMVELYQGSRRHGIGERARRFDIAYMKGYGVKRDRDEALAIADALVREHDWFFGAWPSSWTSGGRRQGTPRMTGAGLPVTPRRARSSPRGPRSGPLPTGERHVG